MNWDVVSDYSPMAYPSFDAWMIDTIKTILDIDNIQWLIKLHPTEEWVNPESGVGKLIARHFPKLPNHISVIPAGESLSPLNFSILLTAQ